MLNGALVVEGKNYGERQFYTVQVTDVGINIFDRSYNFHASYNNTCIRSVVFSDDAYLYTLSDAIRIPISKIGKDDYIDEGYKESKESSGVYVYDLSRLVTQDKVEYYKLSSAIAGINSNLSFSEFN